MEFIVLLAVSVFSAYMGVGVEEAAYRWRLRRRLHEGYPPQCRHEKPDTTYLKIAAKKRGEHIVP